MNNINKKLSIGIIITLNGSVLYVLSGVFAKILGQHLLLNQIMFLQSIAGLSCAATLTRLQKLSLHTLYLQRDSANHLRIIMSLLSIYALIYGLHYMSVFNALVILNLSPFIMPLLRRIFLKKRISRHIWFAIVFAFTGVVFILSPDKNIFNASLFIVLLSMVCLSFSLLILEKTQDKSPFISIFYYFLYSTLITAIILIVTKEVNFDLNYVPLGLFLGGLFFVVQLSIIYATQYISSQLIAILYCSEILLALVASIFLDGLILNSTLMMGTFLILIGSIAAIFIENKSY